MKSLLCKERARQVLATRGWLALQNPKLRDALFEAGQPQLYDPGEYTYHIGDDLGGIFGVVEGSFGVMGQNPASGIVMGHIYRAGSWFGEGPMAVGARRMLEFRAMEPSVVLQIPLAALDRMQKRDPGIRNQLMTLVAFNSAILIRALSDLLIRRADQRIAAVLLRVTGADGHDGPYVPNPVQVTQSDLAELSNCSRHTVNATLKKFEQESWLEVGYGTLNVISPDALRRYLEQ
ncbi:Crp/Fnr family transcriptional regulator [Paracoccus laeviglucosivorans]|uniref:cAMP-binding domain of CRP or a regulatory subunit of cAMP-dependent protein kinases n=1 Tax=Paracoccus laeviglucosivorans TaxID=1197861 RepID=A0A521BD36_9RHOB|nr:Crp/Fnr family transcriptional regulator [Paracoccus laeviglucosivorans]SMO45004.1 cAMP-binding domain of CRP or a regulatory subunit of cAMP-dependent protein kinases [Paracoccus laeviglucosivorans]